MAMNLKKFKMPKGKMEEKEMDEEFALDFPMAGDPEPSEEEESEGLDLEGAPEGESEEMPNPLEEFSDDEILEEFKKRGLSLEESSEGSESPAPSEEASEY